MPGTEEKPLALAILLHDGKPLSLDLESSIKRLSLSWKLERLEANKETCKVLKRIRVPALMLYSAEGEEVSSAVGDIEISTLVEMILEE